MGVIAVGTGNDWIRMFGIPHKYSEAIRAIVEGHSFLQDVGVVSYHKATYKQERYMANVAGVGFDAVVNRRYNHLKEEGKRGKWLYLWSTLKALLRYSSTGVKVYVDDELVVNDLVYSATIGIGRYNGGGMLQTPDAVADDRVVRPDRDSQNELALGAVPFQGAVQRENLQAEQDEPEPGKAHPDRVVARDRAGG